MPEARLQRTRESLPEGYQFGDSHDDQWLREYDRDHPATFDDVNFGLHDLIACRVPDPIEPR
jgi:hypothetical protein